MILKKLELQGFKSFAKKTVIEFDDDVTGIIGPNGSGKSNIVDAIRWVMGEQRIKPLRAGKMEDIIFSGTTLKKPLGYAQVSMTLDNSSGIFQSEYEEICVTRRLFRQGQSEYYINKTACRLKDVQELFMDTGLGKEGYSVIGQGQIESIVNNSPYERKLLIEEAAGIVKYKMRKLEAERNLERAQNNLFRVSDILTEISGRLPSLKRQSERAEKYVELRNELKALEVGVFVHRMDKLRVRLGENKFSKEAIEESIAMIDGTIARLDEKYRALKSDTVNCEEELSGINNKLHELITTYENSKTEIKLAKQQIENYAQTISDANKEIRDIEDSVKIIMADKAKAQQALDADEARLSEISPEYEAKSRQASLLEQKCLNADKYIVQVTSMIGQKDEMLSGLQQRMNELTSDIASKEYVITNIAARSGEEKTRLNDVSSELALYTDESQKEDVKAKNSLAEILIRRNALEAEIENTKEAISETFTRMQTEGARLDLIKGYESSHQGYNFAVRKLLSEKHSINGAIFGTVGEIIKVADKYTEAVTKALGGAIESVVTDNEHTASECIRLLKQSRWGRVTFLPLNTVRGMLLNDKDAYSACDGFIATANELVNFDNRFSGIINSLLGRTVVVDTLENANKMAAKTRYRAKIVTLDGEILLPGGAITGGKSKNNDEGALKRKNEIEKLAAAVAELHKKYDALLQKKEALSMEAAEIRKEQADAQSGYDVLKEKYFAATQKARLLKEEENKLKSSLAECDRLRDEAEKEKERYCSEKDRVLTDIDAVKTEIAGLREELTKASTGGYKDEYLAAVTAKNEIEKDYAVLNEKTLNKKQALDNIKAKYGELMLMKLRYENALNTAKEETKKLEGKIEELSESDRGYDEKKNTLEERFSSLTQKKDSASKEFYKVNDEIIALNKDRSEAAEKLSKIDVELGRTEVEINHLQSNMLEDYSLTYAQAEQFKSDEINVELSLSRINEIKDKIKKLGNINVDALEEYKELKERFEDMSAQKEDLLKSKEELSKIIDDVTKNMTKIFNQQFSVIQKEFDRVFKILFNGGEARLVLTSQNDLSESGVDIIAQPPKTKLKNISALSGGEKSMTACALIFAILKIKPAPFCVMDEIDAALDDANVGRFCDYLKSICADNQIILVTHKKRTMQAAESLYGVSVASDGITNVFSVKLSQINEKGEAYEQQA